VEGDVCGPGIDLREQETRETSILITGVPTEIRIEYLAIKIRDVNALGSFLGHFVCD
jgi:hypothetical protein